MTRFLLAVAILSCAITSIALSTDVPENSSAAKPAPANLNPVYVKFILPVDPANAVIVGDQPVVESWIVKSIDENPRQANFRAVSGWVRLDEDPFETTELWNGGLKGVVTTCPFHADITERKDGWIKIDVSGGLDGDRITVALPDEPGSREVAPMTQAQTKHGMPHVAILIGPQVQ